jgi:hypothetical protein
MFACCRQSPPPIVAQLSGTGGDAHPHLGAEALNDDLVDATQVVRGFCVTSLR